MGYIRKTSVPIISSQFVHKVILNHRDDIDKSPGGVLTIDTEGSSFDYDTSNQVLRTLHYSNMNRTDIKFTEHLIRIWREHDYEQMVMCFLSTSKDDQILVLPKPWVKQTRSHCGCGAIPSRCSVENKRHIR